MTAPGKRLARRSRGAVLPLVLIGMLLLLAMSAVLQQAAWRSARGARTQWDAQRGQYTADEAVVRALAGIAPDSLAATAVAVRLTRDETGVAGWHTRVTLVRTAALTAVAHAVTARTRAAAANQPVVATGALGDPVRIRRTVLRAIRLEPPPVPLLAAATLLGAVTLGSATLDGRDQFAAYEPARDDCGRLRDSASVAAVAAATLAVRDAPELFGAVMTIGADAVIRARATFDNGFAQVTARAQAGALSASGTVPASSPWRASVIRSDTSVTVSGASAYVGLLAFDGDLTIRGALRVDGLLLVRGAIDAAAGVLDVRGALVVRDANARGSHLGPGTRVTYAPCLAGRALAAVATPRPSPFGVWNSP